MRVCSFVLLFYPILFCCLLAAWPVWAKWQGDPPLKNEYNEHEFLAACREGNVPAVEFYLADEDFDPNTYLRSGISRTMTTGVYVAAQNGHDEVMKILADNERVNLNQTGGDDATPVFIASKKGHDKVVQILADSKRADLNQTWSGLSPVYIASHQGHDKVVEVFVQAEGVDLNQTADDGSTPVFIASQQGNDKVVQILAHIKGVDLNREWSGKTPLYMASQQGHVKVVQILIDAGANPTIKWSWGIISKTARTIATCRRPYIRKRNPETYDAYSQIIKNLKLAEQQWKIKNAAPVTPIDDGSYSHWDDSEDTPLLRHVKRVPVTGACQ